MVDAGGLKRWIEAAPPGAATVYAQGKEPPRELAVVVASLADQGLAVPHRKRMADGRFQFQLRRSSAPVVAGSRQKRMQPPGTVETTLLRIARDAARRGLPFPTNRELAALCGVSGALSVSYRLRKLVARGLIEIAEVGPYERRVVTVTSTGWSTPRATIDGLVLR